jgi:N-acetylglucosamine malate deacetylase 1
LPLSNRRLMDGFDERCSLATEFRRWKPRIVVGLGNKTPMASPDHYQAVQITDAAVFYARLTKWEQHFEGTPPHTIQKQLYFKLGFEAGPIVGFDAQFTVDITDSLDAKIEAIRCYATQFPPAKESTIERVKGIAINAGTAAGVGAGEVFSSTKPIVIHDPIKLLLQTL